MNKIILINKYLTSSEFYKNVLSEVQIVLRYHDKIDSIIFDFSGTRKIEPNVIPNLLCLGRVIESILGRKAVISIPDTYEGGKVKNYLYLIGFTKLAGNVFRFEQDPYGGLNGKQIDPLCGTIYFEDSIERDYIALAINDLVEPFAEKYLNKFERLSLEDGQMKNQITDLLKELAENAKVHGKSYSYTTVHANYMDRIIYIAISDSGIGFRESCIFEHKQALFEKQVVLHNELEAILYCVYMRNSSMKFGLYPIIRDVLRSNGIVRIHSNNTQIIFTPRIMKMFMDQKLLKDSSFCKFNVRQELYFGGTHIEIEIPF